MTKNKKNNGLIKIFRKARVNYPPCFPISVGVDWAAMGVNARVAKNLGPLGHTAWDEIRLAMTYEGFVNVGGCNLDPEHIRSTGDETGLRILMIMDRYAKWKSKLKDDRKTMKVVELFINFTDEYMKPRQIEKAAKIRHGTGIKRLVAGLKVYVEILRAEKKV